MQEMQAASPQFITVWPNYIDANKTLPEGRRIPKARACESRVDRQSLAACPTPYISPPPIPPTPLSHHPPNPPHHNPHHNLHQARALWGRRT